MKTAQLTLSVSRDAGGLLDCVRGLVRRLQNGQGVSTKVLGLEDRHTADDLPSWQEISVRVFPRRFGFAAPGMAEVLRDLDVSLVHTHGLWSYCSLVAQRWGQKTRRPYVVSPQGMLDTWALKNSRWKKQIAASLFERRHLDRAACLHAVSASELAAIRAYGLRNPVCVIPNGVELPPDEPVSDQAEKEISSGVKTLLFLGRLHPKKGIPNLLRAWSKVASQRPAFSCGWQLKIAGWDQGGHAGELHQLVSELRLTNTVKFVGPLYGEAKATTLRTADAFVLPSFSEGLPLSVLEAWSYRLPVLMTPECNIPEGFAAKAAFCANPNAESLAIALDDLFHCTDSDLRDVGRRGRALVEKNFTWSSVARQMNEVYQWLTDAGSLPNFMSKK